MWETPDELPAPATTTTEQFLTVRGLPLRWDQLAALV